MLADISSVDAIYICLLYTSVLRLLKSSRGFFLSYLKIKRLRIKCSHLSFLAREDEVKCLHSLMIIME